jgi:hypothetical protein
MGASSQADQSRYPLKGVVRGPVRKRLAPDAGGLAGPADAGAFPTFTYNGGPLIETPQVFALFIGDWSSSANQTRATNLGQFISDMLNSNYMNMLAQYGTGSSGTLVDSVFIASSDKDLSATDIQTIIQSAIDAGRTRSGSFSRVRAVPR